MSKLEALLAAEPNARVAVDDILWAVLNSREFLFGHNNCGSQTALVAHQGLVQATDDAQLQRYAAWASR